MSSETTLKRWDNINIFDEYLSLIVYPLDFIVMVFLCILYVYLFIKDKNSKTHLIILISLILSIFYCVLSFIFIDDHLLLFGQYQNNKYFYVNLIFGIFILQRTCIYLFNTYKLKLSFKDSVFEINSYKIGITYCIFGIMCCGYFVIIYITSHNEKNQDTSMVLGTFVIIDILCAFISVKIFAIKINKLLAMQMFPEMKFMVYKLMVLCIIDIISSIIFILIPGILLYEYIKPCKIFCIDLIINNVCLILTFGKSNAIYKKLCCCFQCKMRTFWSSLITLRSRSPIDLSPTMTTPIPNSTVNTPKESSSDNTETNVPNPTPNNNNMSDDIVPVHETGNNKHITKFEFSKDPTSSNPSNPSNKVLPESIFTLSKKFNPKKSFELSNMEDPGIEIVYGKHSNTLKLPYKSYSSTNTTSLSAKDSISVSQQIIVTKPHNRSISTQNPISKSKRPDSIEEFVTKTMVEVQEPTGIEGNEVELTHENNNDSINDTSNNDTNIDTNPSWDKLTIKIDNNDDAYEALKRKTPSTCVKQMKELGIIM